MYNMGTALTAHYTTVFKGYSTNKTTRQQKLVLNRAEQNRTEHHKTEQNRTGLYSKCQSDYSTKTHRIWALARRYLTHQKLRIMLSNPAADSF